LVNIVWMLLIVLGFISSLIFGNLEHSTQSALEGAKDAVELCIGLAGVYALWLGLMKVAERSGLADLVNR
jgi:spore maturation protein A